MEDNNQQNIPLLCRKGCGFYGSPNFDGLCSKCHRSAQAQLEGAQPGNRASPSIESKLSIPDCPGDKPRPEHTFPSDKPHVAIKVSAEASTPEPEKADLPSDQSGSPQRDLQADAKAISLSDDLLDALKDSKPGSPGHVYLDIGFPSVADKLLHGM
ncbi:unnamed protein product [Echinostoma caproni]|uniref:A20-type domain-containing protein n=1 Tax=Echinostoma caproni TaxID=27848 RepID=A0A183BBL2_9TREM|nr:unnamed protein product [Echinostoma caproni]